MPVPAEISQLVELFERNYDHYRASTFTEAAFRHTRRRQAANLTATGR